MVFGGETFERCLGHEGRAFVNGVSTLITETPESSPRLGQGEDASHEPGGGPSPKCGHAGALILDLCLQKR